MIKILNWLYETFPPKEFMLRSTGGIKYFRLGTAMQIILISLLITSGCLVALFTFKMQYLQTVNYKQNVALKDLRLRYSKFTDSVVSLRSELIEDRSNFADTDLNVELQVKKVTKLLDLLNADLALINKNANIKGDNRLTEVKSRLESIINEKKDREKMLLDLDVIIEDLQDNIDKIYKRSNSKYYIDSNFSTVFYNKEEINNANVDYKTINLRIENNTFSNLERTIMESVNATTELKMLQYNLAMQREKELFFYDLNSDVKKVTLSLLEERIAFLEKIFKKTKTQNLMKFNIVEVDKEVGGPLETENGEGFKVAYAIFENSNKFGILRDRFLSVPLAAPMNKFYITSAYGYRKDPYTKRRAFHKGIDLGASWGSSVLSTASGKISFVGRYGAYGKSVFVDHGNGIETRYAHLSKILVKKGETVDLGQIIGKIGNTGRSTGKHLHYEIKVNKKAKNPWPFLKIGKNVFKEL